LPASNGASRRRIDIGAARPKRALVARPLVWLTNAVTGSYEEKAS
jgi:hypothetical protein